MRFEALDPKKHDRKSFDCDVPALNHYLQRYANQDLKRSLTRIYVLAEGSAIIGYYSISAHSVRRDNLPEDIEAGPYEDIPFLLLGRLAVDKRWQGQGYGDTLIVHAFHMTRQAASQIGILGMVVEAKDEKAADFYAGFGFQRLAGTALRLVLPITAMDVFFEV
ncbi:GNAT family N-acetyltransferase [Pararhizobium mangrovi]|uniref:GNAT family N-acetyltransferase n=1 Tax=Pararhizobium mangrovi TaxID=2590452 RepID=A0A506TXZ2_9HYPH|nr:GNAT family N-acetyltransferase [Pararhizobium mangrovi]TPW25831.1 GNAT family N-acetyltransferase [Pararhizobium mangrovi]